MSSRKVTVTLFVALSTVLCADNTGRGQSPFEQFGRALEGELRRQIQPNRDSGRPAPPDSQTQPRSFDVPNESTPRNNRGDFGRSRFQRVVPNSRYNETYRETVPNQSSSSGSSTRTSSAYSNLPITIKCPSGETGSCPYVLRTSGQAFRFSIEPGQQQKFKESRPWRVSYTASNGEKTYRLRGGNTYSFQKNRSGSWQLYKLPAEEDEEPPLLTN